MRTDTTAISCFPHFYDATEHFARRFDRAGRQWAFRGRTRREAAAWQRRLRAKLIEVLGLDTFEPARPRPARVGREDMGDHWREDWTIRTEPDVVATFYALVPKGIGRGERRPAVICPHGHGSAGRFSPAGRRDIEIVARQIEAFNYDYAVQFARRGLVAFAMDARGFGQRRVQGKREDKKDASLFIANSCHELMLMGQPLGQSVAGMWTWDLMRLVDYAAGRPEVDPRRIGCAGLSGGGLQTLYLGAVDRRIRAAVISGYFYGAKDSLIRLAGNCDCNCVPHLWKYADVGDVAGLIAPRPLLIETGDEDPLNGAAGLGNVYPQVRAARKVYRALAAGRQLRHHVFHGGHRWCGEQALPWMDARLGA